jgi:hypothetical protein
MCKRTVDEENEKKMINIEGKNRDEKLVSGYTN